MSQAWSGNISTDDPATRIQGVAYPPQCSYTYADHHVDVQIWAHHSSTLVPVSKDAKLHFLSLVDVARIPLHLAAGPSCDVSTTNEATTRWLTEALLDCDESDLCGDASKEPWWSHSGLQSENGILLRVETENEEEKGIRNAVTEMLLYAAVANTGPMLPNPLTSFSPAPPDEDLEDALKEYGKSIKVFALPLCSNVTNLVKNTTEVCPPTLTKFQNARHACFLPYTQDPARVTQPVPQKRQSISTLFEDATQKRRRFKGRGGESISQAMASIDRPPSQHEIREKQEAPEPPLNDIRGKSLPRTSSMTPFAGSEQSRPASHSGTLANGKRSSLHRVESAISPRDSPALSDADGSYAQQNKAALTKVVMAAMRLHGLQQKKKPPSKSQLPNPMTLHTDPSVISNEAEDEYKLVYHQTFRAAMFTFRKHLNALFISQETMRDVVDRLLTMFCTDPMIVDPRGSEFAELEANDGLPSSSPFDKPSNRARLSNVASGWNTPAVKKR